MALARNQGADRADRNHIRRQAEYRAGALPNRLAWGREAAAIDAARNNSDTLACDSGTNQCSRNAFRNRGDAVNHPIVEPWREQPVRHIVHAASYYQCTSSAKGVRRHRMGARRVKMDYVIVMPQQQRAKPQACGGVERISDF